MSSPPHPADTPPAVEALPTADVSPRGPAGALSHIERVVIALALVVLAALRWLSITSHQWNTDEPQHLHVVWRWTAGYLQYRDYFDNHTPLFHMLNAPLLRWFGERADIVLKMREAMIPLFAASLWCVYRLSLRIYDRRTAIFAALLAAFLPAFFSRMGEFRTDVMWTTVWLLALVAALEGELTPRRTFGVALLLGAAFAVSMKTTLLLFCLAAAGGVTWQLAGRPISKAWPRHAAAFLAGLIIVPGIIVAYFASQEGGLPAMYQCVIKHNTLPGQNLAEVMGKHLLAQSTLWLIPTWICAAAMLPEARREPRRGYRRLFLFLLTGGYYSLLWAFWPVVTTQDYLPWLPLLPIFAVAGAAWLRQFLRAKFGRTLPWLVLPSLLLAGEIAWVVRTEWPFPNAEAGRIETLQARLRLADPGEYVLDAKGETIFRPRPCYLLLESLTLKQIQLGILKDDIRERLIKTSTAVVGRLGDRGNALPDAERFIASNYIRVKGGHVLGQHLPAERATPITFDIVIPERYGFATLKGDVQGTLDGTPIAGPRWLEAGRHEANIAHPAGEVSLVWARALERGYSPYTISKWKSLD